MNINAILEEIAKKELDIPTLECRNSDSLDFYGCGVVSIKRALVAAYIAGQQSIPYNSYSLN